VGFFMDSFPAYVNVGVGLDNIFVRSLKFCIVIYNLCQTVHVHTDCIDLGPF